MKPHSKWNSRNRLYSCPSKSNHHSDSSTNSALPYFPIHLISLIPSPVQPRFRSQVSKFSNANMSKNPNQTKPKQKTVPSAKGSEKSLSSHKTAGKKWQPKICLHSQYSTKQRCMNNLLTPTDPQFFIMILHAVYAMVFMQSSHRVLAS